MGAKEKGCSCSFRHLYSIELGFSEPVDWYPEEEDEIKATLEVIKVIRGLLEGGAEVDCIDAWEGDSPHPLTELEVDLGEISDEAFRFYENHHFIFLAPS